MGPRCAHYALGMRPPCIEAAKGFNLWAKAGAIMHQLRADHAPTLARNRFEVESLGPQWGQSVPTIRSLCTHYVLKPLSDSAYRPTVGPLCVYYAPTMHPPWVSTALAFNRRAHSGATLCPLCAPYAPTMS